MASTWTQAEDDLLRSLVSQHGAKKWAVISAQLGSKGSKQCRRRWKNYLNVELKKGGWTAEEDAVLLSGHKKFGNKWTEIAKLVGGRTDNAVKNRFAALCKRTGHAVEPARSARKSRAAAAHSSDSDDEEDGDDSNEDELDVAADFKHDQQAPGQGSSHGGEHKAGASSRQPQNTGNRVQYKGSNYDSNHGEQHNSSREGAGVQEANMGNIFTGSEIPSSAVASATAAVQAAIAAFTSQARQSGGSSSPTLATSLGFNALPASPTPSVFMSIFLSSPQGMNSAGLGLNSPRGGLLGGTGLGSGPLDQLVPSTCSLPSPSAGMQLDIPSSNMQSPQLPITQLKLELPNFSSFPSETFPPSPSSTVLASALETGAVANQLKRSIPIDTAANEEGRVPKRRHPIPPSPWQQAFTGGGASNMGLALLRTQYNTDLQGHQQGQYSTDPILIQTAMSSTPRTPCTPKLMATAQEAAARQVATAKALAEAASGTTTVPYGVRGAEASPSASPAPGAQPWSSLLAAGGQKRGYKKPGGLSISIPEATPSAASVATNPRTSGLTIRVYKDLLTPCEVEYAKELNDMDDVPVHIELEDAPLSTSRRATMQALSALLSPGNPLANTSTHAPENMADVLSWMNSSGITPKRASSLGGLGTAAKGAAAPTPAAAVATTTKEGETASAAQQVPLDVRDKRNAEEALDMGEASKVGAEGRVAKGGSLERPRSEGEKDESGLHSGHRSLLVKLIGASGNGDEDSKMPSGVIVPSPRRALALSPSNYTFGLDSSGAGTLLSPMWGSLEGLLCARGRVGDVGMTPRMSNDEMRQLLETINSDNSGR